MRCEDIMKKDVECVRSQDNVQAAARKMRDSNIGFLPVCDDSGKVLGTLTDRDITIRLVADGGPLDSNIEEIMTREVVSCAPSDDLDEARRLMGLHHKSRILCCDENGILQGVISLSDIAQASEEQGASTLREVSEREAPPIH